MRLTKSLHAGRSPWRQGLPTWGNITWSEISLLLRRFVFRTVEASAKHEWPVMNRKGPWEGYRRFARCLLAAFLCAHIKFIERETSGHKWGVKWENEKYKLERSIDLFYSFDRKQCKIIFLYEETAQSPQDLFRTLFNMAAVSMFRIPIWPAVTSYDSLQIQERLPFEKLKLVRQIRTWLIFQLWQWNRKKYAMKKYTQYGKRGERGLKGRSSIGLIHV